MDKDFDGWNSRKKNIHEINERRFYHPRDIWWCSFGINIGAEEDGRGSDFQRPVLIIKGLSRKTCFVVPLTTSLQIHKYRIDIGLIENKEAKVILSQMKVIDTKRLSSRITTLDSIYFETIKKSIKDML